jgi:chromosome segregation ATPase
MSQESKHADLLNVLDAMAGNMHYAVRRQELRQAEQLIVEQEEALDSALARAERAEARLAECERERDQARRDCDDLHNELGRLHGHVFSKRDYHAMLARIENTQERAVKAEAEVRELREEITRLRAALESRKESMDARNLHDPAR